MSNKKSYHENFKECIKEGLKKFPIIFRDKSGKPIDFSKVFKKKINLDNK